MAENHHLQLVQVNRCHMLLTPACT